MAKHTKLQIFYNGFQPDSNSLWFQAMIPTENLIEKTDLFVFINQIFIQKNIF
jgi:hypothetical protein